jgi:hypothetical protein
METRTYILTVDGLRRLQRDITPFAGYVLQCAGSHLPSIYAIIRDDGKITIKGSYVTFDSDGRLDPRALVQNVAAFRGARDKRSWKPTEEQRQRIVADINGTKRIRYVLRSRTKPPSRPKG